MTERVDFYVLKTKAAKERWTFACRLTEKAYQRDLCVVVLNDTAADANSVDELLWTFNERSFVPHEIHRGEDTATPGIAASGTAARDTPAPGATTPGTAAPVQLTTDLNTIGGADLLVNLSARLPIGLERFARIAEIIDADDERRRLGRQRFKAYRDLKLPLETHQLNDAEG